jgi:hypothetical protein
VLAGAGVAVTALVSFALWERRTPTPMLNLQLLRNRRLAGASTVGALLMFALAGSTFMLTQYMQLVLGYSALSAGLRTVPVALAVGMTAPFSAQLARKLGDGLAVALGLITVAAGLSVIGLRGRGFGAQRHRPGTRGGVRRRCARFDPRRRVPIPPRGGRTENGAALARRNPRRRAGGRFR